MLAKYGTNPQSCSFASRQAAIEYHNTYADYWRYDIGVNVIPAQTKLKKTSIKWLQYQNAPIPESQHTVWKNSGAFTEGMAIIAGKVWHRARQSGPVLYTYRFR